MTMRRHSPAVLLIGLSLLAGCGKGSDDARGGEGPAVPVRVQASDESAQSSASPSQTPVHVVATSVFAAPLPVQTPLAAQDTAPAGPPPVASEDDADPAVASAPDMPGQSPTPLPAPVPTPLATPPVPEKPAVPVVKAVPAPVSKPLMVSPVGDTSAYPVGPTVPVKPGYYAIGDTPCDRVSAKTVLVLYRDGMDSAAGSCAWSDVKAGPGGSWRVTRHCLVGQQEGVSDGTAYTRTARVALAGKGAFTLSDEGAARPVHAKWCPQASLPEPWRSQPPIGG